MKLYGGKRRLTIYMEPIVYEKIIQIAKDDKRSFSNLMNKLAIDHVMKKVHEKKT